MKWIWLFMFILSMAACREEKKEQADPLAYAVITGHIKNRQVYPQQQALKVIIPSFRNAQTIQECEIKPDDSFAFRFQPLALRDISIETFIPFILIRPGDSLHIELDFANLNKVEFTGSAGKLNNDLYAFTDGGGYYLEQRSGTDDRMKAPVAFRAKMQKEREIRLKRVNDFSEKYQVEPDLEKWLGKGLEIEYYKLLLEYGVMHFFLTRDTVPEEYFDFDAAVESLFAEDVIHSGLFELATQFQSRVKKAKDLPMSDSTRLENTANCTKNKVLSQFMVASSFDGTLGFNDVTFFENNRAFFDEHITLPLLRESLLQKYRDKKAYLTNPKPLSDAMLFGKDHEKGMAPVPEPGMKKLQDVVRKNAGKVMLVNFWGGCSAALVELEPLSELVKAYDGKEVEFVSITSESPYSHEWAGKYSLGEESYFWKTDEIQQIMRSWHVTWSPYYLLINKEGIIVDYGSHIRPGSSYTKEKIDKLLQQ